MTNRTARGIAFVSLLLGICAILYPIGLFAVSLSGIWYYADIGDFAPFLIPASVAFILGLTINIQRRNKRTTILVASVAIIIAIITLIATDQRRIRRIQEGHILSCMSNLRQLDSAKEQWAISVNASNETVVVTNEVTGYIKGNTMPWCQAVRRQTYALGKMGENPSCSVHGTMFDHHLPDGKKICCFGAEDLE